MQRDVKIGIAIGVLLIALIAVFWWFRHTGRNMPVTETGPAVSENELPGPVVPVSPPMGVPGEIGPMASATGTAPMMTAGEPVGTVAMPAATAVAPPPPLPVAAKQTYKVQHDDTLSSISEQFYKTTTKWRLIYDANKEKIGPNPDKLKDGMELVIPEAAATASISPAPTAGGTGAAGAGGKYVVVAGDNLTSIAQKWYGSATEADINRIYQANKAKIGPDRDALKVGMELVIPAAH
jgi:nucleoid-associated protein YgaU